MELWRVFCGLQYGLGLWAIVPASLAGGCFGWLACDFADAKRSVKIAWKQVVGWKPNVEWWKDFGLANAGACSTLFSMFFWLLSLDRDVHFAVAAGVSAILAIMFSLFATILGLAIETQMLDDKSKKFLKVLLFRWNVVSLPFSLLWYFGKGVIWLLPRVPFAVKTAGKFLWHAFILAHSSKRRICFIGTTIGAIAGLLFASMNGVNLVLGVVLPGILGALFSLIWNEIVAVRWLGIKPV